MTTPEMLSTAVATVFGILMYFGGRVILSLWSYKKENEAVVSAEKKEFEASFAKDKKDLIDRLDTKDVEIGALKETLADMRVKEAVARVEAENALRQLEEILERREGPRRGNRGNSSHGSS